MKKKIKVIMFYLITAALLSFLLIYIKDYNNWWLNKIGVVMGIENKVGQWVIVALLDIIVKTGIIIAVVFVAKKYLRKEATNSMSINFNVKKGKACAFCKHWYDPTNRYISPKAPNINLWEYDFHAKCKCLKRGIETKSMAFCPHYECKIPIK